MQPTGSAVRATLGLAAGLAAAALVLAASAGAQPPPRALPGLAPAAADGLSRALAAGRLSEAEYALERARSLFRLGRVRREFGDVERPGGRDATLILRDLAVRLDDLRGAERRLAEAILARPTDGDVPEWTHAYEEGTPSRYTCGADMCFHWVETTADAPDMTDTTPPDGIPDWVGEVQATWEHVWSKEIDEYKYRKPLEDSASAQADGPAGADLGKLDVYVVDIGAEEVFGYCATLENGTRTPVYCVVDNDYAEFAGQTPKAFLQVTSAHEFHHASQAAYDFWEDFWLIEGTATNIEETVYEEVNDNVSFLRQWSPLTRPGSPLDRGGAFDNSEYGAWIFWRYLEEKVAGGDHAILREIWKRAAGDSYSLKATTRELAERGISVPDTFVRFAVTNRRRGYADAAEARYPTPPLAARVRIGQGNREIGWRSKRINHLASQIVAFLPRGRVARDARLRIRVEQPSYANGARVAVMVVRENGSRYVRYPRPNANGIVSRRAGFGRGSVARVEVVLANGSTRTRCWRDPNPPWYSCFGNPRDDRRLFRYRARIVD